MESEQKQGTSVYAEATPNPEVIKFVVNRPLINGEVLEYANMEEASGAPLAQKLFELEGVENVFIMNDFVSVTKSADKAWVELIPVFRNTIKEHLENDGIVITEEALQKAKDQPSANEAGEDEAETIKKIKDILNNQVKPAVEMDGGAIDFKSFENGIVTVQLRGACSGCPSSMVTLKAGIEGLLKRMVPDVQGVEAEEA